MDETTDTTGASSTLFNILDDGLKFATPFAQSLLGQKSTPAQIQAQTLKDATLNGSGPLDPTLAKQAPLGLIDFITGGKVTGATRQAGAGGLTSGPNYTILGFAAIALVAVLVIIRK